jgi:hypothetical protein
VAAVLLLVDVASAAALQAIRPLNAKSSQQHANLHQCGSPPAASPRSLWAQHP